MLYGSYPLEWDNLLSTALAYRKERTLPTQDCAPPDLIFLSPISLAAAATLGMHSKEGLWKAGRVMRVNGSSLFRARKLKREGTIWMSTTGVSAEITLFLEIVNLLEIVTLDFTSPFLL